MATGVCEAAGARGAPFAAQPRPRARLQVVRIKRKFSRWIGLNAQQTRTPTVARAQGALTAESR
eukprot:7836068-Lingulodinium_polyedra.AAC.1